MNKIHTKPPEFIQERRKPELLAPAGGPDALRAAVCNGADAVYLGVEILNARRNAENFTLDTLGEACRFAHLAGVRIYLTVNTAVLTAELPEALNLVARAWESGVDAVIIQDIGLLSEVHRLLPEVEIHTSTQMNIHDTAGVRLAAELGASRVTLSRELSIAEISTLAECGVDLEIFGHGALCVCYSGQCLMSSLIGRRSANRGLCAQPCRLPWSLIDESGASLTDVGEHLLSPKDLCTIEILPELIDAGIASLKIEGRMKSAEYVALVTSVYRHALDRAFDDPSSFKVSEEEHSRLSEAFSRGFTTAYLTGDRSNSMMSYQRPNNRGIQVGRIASIRNGLVTISTEREIAVGDTLEYWTSRGRFAQEIDSMSIDGVAVDRAPEGSRPELVIRKPVAPGDRVFRVRNGLLATEVAASFDGSASPMRPVDVSVTMRIGEPLIVELHDVENESLVGRSVGATIDAARTKAVTEADVIDHVGRFGGTSFEPRSWKIDLDENAGIGFSTLHRVRREAVESLEEAVLAPWSSRTIETSATEGTFDASALFGSGAADESISRRRFEQSTAAPTVVALVSSPAAANACVAAGADTVQVSTLDFETGGYPDCIVVAVPNICHDVQTERLLRFLEADKDVVVGNLSTLSQAVALGAHPQIEWSACALNRASLNALANLGAEFAWLSPELSYSDLRGLVPSSPIPLGLTVSGSQEVMATEHCEFMAQGECGQTCSTCTRREGRRYLEDRKNYRFPVRTDGLGRGHIYNAVALDLTASLADVIGLGISAIRVDATLLTPEQAAAEVHRVISARNSALMSKALPEKLPGTTTGHFHRGVL